MAAQGARCDWWADGFVLESETPAAQAGIGRARVETLALLLQNTLL